MEIEKWMPVDGTNGAYDVSNYGRVRSLPRYDCNSDGVRRLIPGGVLSQGTDRWGYRTVVLRINKKSKTFRVHRLVAIAFVPMINGREFIDHIDNNKGNNHYTNLRWVTRSENMLNPITVARSKNARKVYQYTMDGNFVKEYQSISEAARENNLRKKGIRAAAYGRSKRCGRFMWSFKPL